MFSIGFWLFSGGIGSFIFLLWAFPLTSLTLPPTFFLFSKIPSTSFHSLVLILSTSFHSLALILYTSFYFLALTSIHFPLLKLSLISILQVIFLEKKSFVEVSCLGLKCLVEVNLFLINGFHLWCDIHCILLGMPIILLLSFLLALIINHFPFSIPHYFPYFLSPQPRIVLSVTCKFLLLHLSILLSVNCYLLRSSSFFRKSLHSVFPIPPFLQFILQVLLLMI